MVDDASQYHSCGVIYDNTHDLGFYVYRAALKNKSEAKVPHVDQKRFKRETFPTNTVILSSSAPIS